MELTTEQKTAIQEAAETSLGSADPKPGELQKVWDVFYGGAEEVITSPAKYDLVPLIECMDAVEESDQNWTEALAGLKAENERYKGALMKTANTHDAAIEMDPAGIALKMRDAAQKALKGQKGGDE